MDQPNSLILVVDDDEDWSETLRVVLEKAGYRVHVASSSASAQAWLSSNRPDAILQDIMMPDGNGLDLCRWIRAQQGLEKTPIIINSGIKDDETIEEALEFGATSFLRKPAEIKEIIKAVQKCLGKPGIQKKFPDL